MLALCKLSAGFSSEQMYVNECTNTFCTSLFKHVLCLQMLFEQPHLLFLFFMKL